MSFCEPIVFGDDCSVNTGETIDLLLAFTDETGTALDLSGATLSVVAASQPSLVEDIALTVTDSAGGLVRLFLPASGSAKLGRGMSSWFRIGTAFSSDNLDITPQIWIQTR